MSSNKIGRINDDIQRVLSKLLTEVKDPRVQQGMISVTRVETTGDLRYCKVYLRRELGRALQLRYTPELVFEIDHSIEYGAHISQMISELDIKHDEDEDNEL